VERDEGDLIIILKVNGLQVQMYEVAKGADPTTRIRICGGDERKATDGEMTRVVNG
jgi:hypothetical protein